MINIGVLQEDGSTTHNIIKDVFKYRGNINIDLVNRSETAKSKYNIIISDKKITDFDIDKILCSEAIVVLNIDEKLKCPIKFLNPVKVVTYGFNSKACVTVSSVANGAYNTIQLCIQRSISTLHGEILEPQEFPINTQSKNILNVISAVTTVILTGYDIQNLNSKLFV